jgi:outer membrane protein TolC
MSHAGMTRRQLEIMREEMAKAELEYKNTIRDSRQEVILKLREIKAQLNTLVSEAEKLAESVDLKFYYSSGYEEFSWADADNWSSSSAHC